MPSDSSTFAVFAHLNVDHTPLYCAILELFVAERARFVISLHPAEIHAALDAALQQLRTWRNLDDTADNADAATIEEFYQRRRLYQLSAAGEAAEQALALFHEHLHRPGELQTAAPQDIGDLLEALLPRLADTPLDSVQLIQQCDVATSRATRRSLSP